MFDPILGVRRDAFVYPIAVESPDEQSIAALNQGKPDLFQVVRAEDFYL